MAEQIGKYLLLKKIATGGMAELHLAEQSGPGGFKKRLVLKRILPHLLGDENFLKMFQDEARVAAMMNHPNIVQIFDLGEHDGTYYIAMEYVAGFNLRSLIRICNANGLWLSPEYIAKIGSQICEGLEYAHNFCDVEGNHLNLIHRDVSPQNLILSRQGMIKIVDFGIAKAKSTQQTQAGTIKGKLAYMSPEQVKGLQLDRRSDIFSLGIVLYELATYNRPIQGKTDIDMLRAILNSPPQSIQSYRPDFPTGLSAVIERALSKERDIRYASARDMQWDLERFIQQWDRPIQIFQLQELVQQLEHMEQAESEMISPPDPSSPSAPPPSRIPTPAPEPTPHALSQLSQESVSSFHSDEFDDFDEDATILETKLAPKQPPGAPGRGGGGAGGGGGGG
ncbi:MAG: serine/threonine-protein kinase, partial [Myxococcota bacterium]